MIQKGRLNAQIHTVKHKHIKTEANDYFVDDHLQSAHAYGEIKPVLHFL